MTKKYLPLSAPLPLVMSAGLRLFQLLKMLSRLLGMRRPIRLFCQKDLNEVVS